MGRQRNEQNAKLVEVWKRKNSEVSPEDMIDLRIKAITAIRKRTLETLSGVTVTAVIDRTLIECKEKHPELREITNDTDGLHFDKFIKRIHPSEAETLLSPLDEFLIDLLDVFGKITADILTKYLHQELLTVTTEAKSHGDSESQLTNSVGILKNRDKK